MGWLRPDFYFRPACLLGALIISTYGFNATADDSIVTVEAIVALTGGTPESEAEARPLLFSDIELEARLMQESNTPPHTLSKEERQRAEERAVMIRLLSDQARRLHETVSASDKAALFAEIAEHMGGVASMNKWLIDNGIERIALDRWIENAVLAVSQLRFLKDQAMLPTNQSATDISDSKTKPQGLGNVKSEVAITITGRSLSQELRRRLTDVAQNSYFKVLR
jgi:hypothetical protein